MLDLLWLLEYKYNSIFDWYILNNFIMQALRIKIRFTTSDVICILFCVLYQYACACISVLCLLYLLEYKYYLIFFDIIHIIVSLWYTFQSTYDVYLNVWICAARHKSTCDCIKLIHIFVLWFDIKVLPSRLYVLMIKLL